MEQHIRRFETRGGRQARWFNVVVEDSRLTTYAGVVGAGPPGLWRRAGKETSKPFLTNQEAMAAATHEVSGIGREGLHGTLPW